MIYKATESRVCKWCGKSFVPKTTWQKCCTNKCRASNWQSENPRVNIEIIKIIKKIFLLSNIEMKFYKDRYFMEPSDMKKLKEKYTDI